MKFNELDIGDMFNTMSARFVKTSEFEAIVVIEGYYRLGKIIHFDCDCNVIPLYTTRTFNNAR